MVWGSFGGCAVVDLAKIDGIMDSKKYNNILVRHAISSGIRLIGRGFILQQNNDPKHTSTCRKYFQSKQRQPGLQYIV